MPAFLAPLIAGVASTALGSILGKGKKPSTPAYKAPDVDKEQERAIEGNLGQAARANELATVTNAYNQEELKRMLRNAIPGYDQMVSKQGEQIQSFLSGEIPDDVAAAIKRNTAEKAGSGGYGGSQFGRNLTARDLGLTSLQLTQQGIDSASRWMHSMKSLEVPDQFKTESMFVTPAQRLAVSSANAGAQFNRDLLEANISAAPSPMASAFGSILTQIGGSLFGAGMQSAFSSAQKPSGQPNGPSKNYPVIPLIP